MGSFRPGDPAAVQQLFEQIAPRYDLLNDLLSLGLHRLWKRQAVAWLAPQPGQQLLDLCCGTGDLSFVLAEKVRPGGTVLGLDVAAAPLQVAAQRGSTQPWLTLCWQQGDAMATGLETSRFDGVVMAYGLRNLSDPAAALAEVRRLLRPGGKAAVLDFNKPDPALPGADRLAGFQRFYLRQLVVPTAERFGVRENYAYLEDSLAGFATAAQQEQLAWQAGFREVRHRRLAAGLMGLLELVA